MWMMAIVFSALFFTVAAAVLGISWVVNTRAELRTWKKRHAKAAEALNDATWRANKEMIMY